MSSLSEGWSAVTSGLPTLPASNTGSDSGLRQRRGEHT
jgi:hypothetical protein